MSFRSGAAVGLCILTTIFSSGGEAQSRPPVEAFGQLPLLRDPQLSPDGKYVAAIQAQNGRPLVVIYTVGSGNAQKPIGFQGGDWIIEGIEWLKNNRLAIDMKKGLRVVGDTSIQTWERTIAVSPDGRESTMLNNNQDTLGYNLTGGFIIDRDLDDPDLAFVPLYVRSASQDLRCPFLP